jgi:hypothetical protein
MRLSNMSSRRRKSWWPLVAIVAVCSLPLSFVWLIFGHNFENFMHQRKFDDQIWRSQSKSEPYSDWPPRLCMVDDLLASGRLNGMTKSQVIEFLGPPVAPYSEGLGFSYYLGPERGFIRIDSETLIVEFGVDGKLSRARIYRD